MATENPLRSAAMDRFLAEKSTNAIASKWEVWSYYGYVTGCNQLIVFSFTPSLLQYLISLQAGDTGLLTFLGSERTVNSILLYSNGICFLVQVVVVLLTGSFADYGTWRPWILIFWTVVACGVFFAWLDLLSPEKWPAGVAVFIVGSVAYSVCYNFYVAAFPRLSRNTSEVRLKADQYEKGDITQEQYEAAETVAKTEISNLSLIWQSVGQVVMLAVAVGILFGVKANDSVENNLYGYAICVAFITAAWILLAIPWFALEKRRPGQVVPEGLNMFTVGFWQLFRAFKTIWRLKQSVIYLLAYILVSDTIGTSYLIVQTLQNEVTAYSAVTLCYLLMVYSVSLISGTYAFWAVQNWFKLSPKTMLNTSIFAIAVVCGWGMVGIWTQRLGFHNVWEFWMYQFVYGFFICPIYSYCNVVMSELTPRGKEYLFFSLFNVTSLTSSFIGPLISGAIIDADTKPDKPGNASLPFYFAFGVSVICFILVVFCVDLDKSKVEQAAFLQEEEFAKERMAGGLGAEPSEPGIVGTSASRGQKRAEHVKTQELRASDVDSGEV